ncbi:Probable serine/threonine-protein kinase kinX, partial [Geodia barretti]
MSAVVTVARDTKPPKFKDLVEELFGVKKKWYSIGLQLNISDGTLDSIDAECKDNHTVALRRMLQEWRKQEETSWAAVVKVLQSQSVGEYTLAKNLKGRYPTSTVESNRCLVPAPQSRQAYYDDQLVPSTDGALNGAVVLHAECDVPDAVQEEIMLLHRVFEELRMEIYKYLEESPPDIKEFAVFVSCPMPSWKKKLPRNIEGLDLKQIMQPGTEFYQMFIVISQYTNWYNYELLDNIAQRYGSPELKGKMAAYRTKLTDFEGRTSAEKLKNIELARPLADSASVIAKLEDNQCNQFTGRDIRRLKHQYTDQAGVDPAAARLYMIKKSSVEIIFLVPISLAPHLMVSSLTVSPLLTSQNQLPEDIHERCVYYMHAEEVFCLMGRTVTPPAPRRVSSASSTQQVQTSGPPVFSSSVSLLSSDPSEMDESIDPSRIHVFHDKVLMNGDSAVVCKAQFLNLPCAAKYLHPKLVETSSWQLENFKKGCKILHDCRHPNIVAFLHIHRDNRLRQPILLMELMDQSLKEFLDHRKLDLPLYLQLDICSDVAQGLEYLHAQDIIHGNLTATNVLVKRGRAKICGLMTLQINTPDGELSLCPGAPESMPRDSFSCADYDGAIDCFSFGVLGIHIATRELPQPNTQAHESSEVERYAKDLQSVEDRNHPLYPLIIKCLNDKDSLRPSATKLCQDLDNMIKSSAYRNSQSAEHISTELVGLQIEYFQDRLSEKTEENKVLKCNQTEYVSTIQALRKKQTDMEASMESMRNSVSMMTLTNKDLAEKAEAATNELEESKKQRSEAAHEKDRMCKDLWNERSRGQTMRDKIEEFKKQRDDYKDKLEESDKGFA